jgi:hypothetical protein
VVTADINVIALQRFFPTIEKTFITGKDVIETAKFAHLQNGIY